MSLMESITSRRFRTRDPERDAATDRQRMDAIRAAVTSAIDSATRERTGLKRRVDDYYASASHILDNTEYGQRSEKQEREVREAERQGRISRERLTRIDTELERYQQLLAAIGGFREHNTSPADTV